jgi:hypothetical protein
MVAEARGTEAVGLHGHEATRASAAEATEAGGGLEASLTHTKTNKQYLLCFG